MGHAGHGPGRRDHLPAPATRTPRDRGALRRPPTRRGHHPPQRSRDQPGRTLFDLAAILTEHRLARAAERAEALRLASPTALAALAARHPRRPGGATIRKLTQVAATPTRSVLERRFLSLLDAENLPRPVVNATVEVPSADGPEADFTWRDSA